jgi:uncharacterized Fe-S cluster protein YjdI
MDSKDVTKHYKKGDLTIVWKSGLCTHSANCFRGLPEVFDPRVKPWIQPENASDQQIIDQVSKCPSGALSII